MKLGLGNFQRLSQPVEVETMCGSILPVVDRNRGEQPRFEAVTRIGRLKRGSKMSFVISNDPIKSIYVKIARRIESEKRTLKAG